MTIKLSMMTCAGAALCGLALALTGLPASADIAAYNAAMKAGNYKAAAAEARNVWATFDKSSPETAGVAREFGFSAYIAGEYAEAREFGQFLKEHGASLPKPDDQPATSAILLAASDYRLSPKPASRDALLSALTARLAQPGVDNISLSAGEALYTGDWSAKSFANVQKSAPLAAELFKRGGVSLQPQVDKAKIAGAAAAFLQSVSRRNIDGMADVHDEIVGQLDAATDNPKLHDALLKMKFQAEAWFDAGMMLFLSADHQTGSNIPNDIRRELKQPRDSFFNTSGDPRPLCAGHFDIGGLQYPTSAEYRELVGAVIIKLSVNDQGAVTGSEVLAAVPAEVFADYIQRQANGWRFVLDKGVDTKTCRLASSDRLFKVVFRIA